MLKGLKLVVTFSLPVMVLLFLSDCKKGSSAAQLSFSTDTLTFDTVFTSVGSTTQYFKIYNPGHTDLTVSNIQLLHLEGNQFYINVNAVGGDKFANVVVPARDSLYVFVEVTVNPNSSSTPFVIYDKVQFVTNGHVQDVVLQAFGQNAHFHYREEIKAGQNVTWSNDLPHVIVGNVATDTIPGVLVDCGATLTIKPGCTIYMSGNAGLLVQGKLIANQGQNWGDSILFRGVRLEPYYDALPGQWFGIVFLRDPNGGSCSGTGTFKYCIVDESSYGIYAGASPSPNPVSLTGNPETTVSMNHTIVRNSQYNAIQAYNANVTVENSLFYAAGGNLLQLGLGGNYIFNFCTIYNIGSPFVNHQSETLLLSNFASISNVIYPSPLNAGFYNCVIYGNLTNEISFNNYSSNHTTQFSAYFSNCCLKTNADTLGLFSLVNTNNLINTDPGFENPVAGNFIPADSMGYVSPIIDYDNVTYPSDNSDLYGNFRPVSLLHPATPYDIGAVERQPNSH